MHDTARTRVIEFPHTASSPTLRCGCVDASSAWLSVAAALARMTAASTMEMMAASRRSRSASF